MKKVEFNIPSYVIVVAEGTVLNEISLLKDINHPNILKIHDVKENCKYCFIITDYYNGGNLEQYLDKYHSL